MRIEYPPPLAPTDDIPTRLLLCALIFSVTIAFLWLYDAAFHRDAPVVPNISASMPERGLYGGLDTYMGAMNLYKLPSANASRNASSIPAEEPKKTYDNSKPKIAKVLRSISSGAANAYASGANYVRREIGAPD